MKINQKGIDIIKECESLRLRAYLCPSGKWTIGWGHTKGVKPGDRCTENQANAWLDSDLSYSCAVVENMVQVPINSNQFSALVSFVYNVGDGNFASSTLLKALNKWLYSEVPNQLKRWKFGSDPVTGKKIELPGLVKRRQMEADLWNDGL